MTEPRAVATGPSGYAVVSTALTVRAADVRYTSRRDACVPRPVAIALGAVTAIIRAR